MRRLDVRVSGEAFSDLAEILFYIELKSPKNADIVESAFYEVVERLAEVPTLGHIHIEINNDRIRFVPFKSFEAAYRVVDDTVQIVRVLYAGRDYTQFDWR